MSYSVLTNNWKVFKLDQVCSEIYSGGTPSRRKEEYWEGGIPWFSSGETSERFIRTTNETITHLGVEKSSTKLALPNDTLIATAGQGFTRGQVSYSLIETYFNQSVIALRPNKDLLDSKFLFYNLSNRYEELRKISDGNSIRGSITTKMLKELDIVLPPIEQQKLISNIVFSFDNKIENNNAIIANLEAQAQAIFKSWFIDFEPFQDGEFVDSELGKIPKGWEVIQLGDVFNFVKGKKPKRISSELQIEYMPYLVKKYIDGFEVSYANPNDGIIIDELNVFMLMDGANSGNIYYGYTGVLGSTFSLLEIKVSFPEDYVYWYLKIYESEIKSQNTGSAIPHANKDYIQSIKVTVPKNINNLDIMKFLRNIRSFSINLKKQNQTLANIRDTLLPKLMSGEIRVGDVDLEEIDNNV